MNYYVVEDRLYKMAASKKIKFEEMFPFEVEQELYKSGQFNKMPQWIEDNATLVGTVTQIQYQSK